MAAYYQQPVTAEPVSAWSSAEQYEMYLALLGLAESLRSQGEPEGAYKCLVGIVALNVPFVVSARIHCEIGKLLLRQSNSHDVAKYYLDSAMTMGANAQNGSALEEVRLDAASSVAEYFVLQNDIAQARDILHTAIEQSQHSPYWQCNFIFQLANVFVQGQDHTVATQILTLGESFSARHQAHYLIFLFQLARAHVFIRAKQYQSALTSLRDITTALDAPGVPVSPALQQELRFYLLTLQTLCRLNLGQAKSVRPFIQPLQAALDALTQRAHHPATPTSHPLEMFTVAPRTLLPALYYAVSAQFFALVGYHDKLDRLFKRSQGCLEGFVGLENSALQMELRCVLYQHAIPTSLTTCRLNQALEQTTDYLTLCCQNPSLLRSRRCQLHVLLGMCALQFGYNEVAESQFAYAYRWCQSGEMMAVLNVNQAVLYYRQQRWMELAGVAQRCLPEQLGVENVGLRCAATLVQALKAITENRHLDAKMLLRSALQMGNEEDLNQLMAVALALLSRNCAALGLLPDALKVATTAVDLAEKIPYPQLQINALKVAADVYGYCGDVANSSASSLKMNSVTEREALEMALVQRNPKLSALQWTGG